MSIVQFRDKRKVAVICDTCFDEITHFNRIRCLDCKEDECLRCFCYEFLEEVHSSHSFKIVKPLNYKKNSIDWSLIDDHMFFEGLKLYGIGNWEDISLLVSSMDEAKIETRFFTLFSIKVPPARSGVGVSRLSNPNSHEVWCYMPLREDFETLFREDFEKLIKDINLSAEDDIDEEIKIQMFEIYKTVLLTRSYRDSFLIKRRIFDMKKLRQKERNYEKEKLEALEMYKPMAILLSKKDFNLVLNGCFIKKKLEFLSEKHIYTLTRREVMFCLDAGLSYALFRKIRRYFIGLMVRKKKVTLEKITKRFGDQEVDMNRVFSFFQN